MTADCFALFGEPRRPFLDPERITETFQRLSRTAHPDRAARDDLAKGDANAEFAALNQAHQTLRDPRARLGCLIGLEFPEVRLSGPSPVPPALSDRIGPILALLQEIDGLLARKADAPSALARALLARAELGLRDHAETHLRALEALYSGALADLRECDAQWGSREPDAAARLLELYQRFAYLSRWIDQLRERLYQLGQPPLPA